ncbi:hypothetical protein DRO61_11740 [Candidatus Bathyarchaeota archaeon]|nr:MAG: hypothetical protein DRO61_11740 [Candidatus Bathyarchaeota archaeon]
MGTNFYMIYNKCDCCDRFDSAHIGKNSGGWQFSFQSIRPEISYWSPDGCLAVSDPKEIIVSSWKDWEKLLKLEENSIRDEYERPVSYLELKKIVEGSMKKKTNKNHTIECKDDYDDGDLPYLDSEGYSFVNYDFS